MQIFTPYGYVPNHSFFIFKNRMWRRAGIGTVVREYTMADNFKYKSPFQTMDYNDQVLLCTGRQIIAGDIKCQDRAFWPAIAYFNDKGQLHNLNGPAIIYGNGDTDYYVNNEMVSKFEAMFIGSL